MKQAVRRRFSFSWIAFGFLAAGCVALVMPDGVGASPVRRPVKVGVGETVITPPVGTPMAGYSRKGVSDGVHDDLHARSLVVEGSNGKTIALMSLSIINLRRAYFDQIREGVSRQTGIPVENIVVSCTHTHSGPEIGPAEDPYIAMLIDRSILSAVEAWKNRAPGRVGTGSAVVPELGRNDRRLSYGGLHPDPLAGIVKIEDAQGALFGVAFNYGCHPSTLSLHNLKFTEDWPCYAIRGIGKGAAKRSVWASFFQSAQGDIKVGYTAELSAVGADMPIRTFEYAERKGNQMSEAVLRALASIQTFDDLTVDAVQERSDLTAREGYRLSAGEAQKRLDLAKEKLARMERNPEGIGRRALDSLRAEAFLAELRLQMARRMGDPNRPKTINILQQAVRVGDAVFVTFPCEVFSEIGLKVKQQSPVPKTFVIGIAGGMGGYLPTAEEFLEDAYADIISPFSPKAGQELVDSSLRLIKRLLESSKEET